MKSNIDFIGGDTKKSLMKLFVPLLLAMILTIIYGMVDSLWVGNMLGEQGLSALTAGTAIVLIMSSVSMGMGNGITVMIARMLGAGEKDKITGACATVITVSTILSLAGCLGMELLTTPILTLMGTPEAILSDAVLYLRLYLLGNVALFIYVQFTSIFRAFGDSMFQMKGMLMTAIFNAVADPFMIKAWGLAGAAIATVISEVMCLVFAFIYYKRKSYFTFDFKAMKMEYAKTMMSLGIPTTIQSVMPALSSAVMVAFVTSFGTGVIAGFGVARNLEYFMFMPTSAMFMAVTTIVGQCNGARRYDRARDYLKAAAIIGGVMIGIISLAVIVFSGNLTMLFGQTGDVAAIVKGYLHIISIGFVLYLITSCIQGYITGMGQPGKAMILLILYYIVFRIPAAVVLKNLFGYKGIWMAFLVSHILAVIVAAIMYKQTAGHIETETITNPKEHYIGA